MKLSNEKMERIFAIYSEEYDFHFCALNEIDDVVNFIDTYWKKNHILVLSRSLMDWQHLDKENRRYNFVVARNRASGEIHGICGFIPLNHFDSSLTFDVNCGAVWKVRDDVSSAGLGMLLGYYTGRTLGTKYTFGIGLSEDAVKNLKDKNKLGFMEHYFLRNPDIMEYRIAKNVENVPVIHAITTADWQLEEIDLTTYTELDENLEVFRYIHGLKSKKFYINRYYLHPVYRYKFFAIKKECEVKSIMVLRECSANKSKCIRIVDYIGKFSYIKNVSAELLLFLSRNNYEYIDILAANIDFMPFSEAGFVNRMKDESIIIPNYFEPFLRENVSISYHYSSWFDETWKPQLFKGDADMDRPNVPWW